MKKLVLATCSQGITTQSSQGQTKVGGIFEPWALKLHKAIAQRTM